MYNKRTEIEKRTQNLLSRISTRLSGRNDCKKVEYLLTITESEDSNYCKIKFKPCIYIYPDRYHKQDTDLASIILYIVGQITNFTVIDDCIVVSRGLFLPGEYLYEFRKISKRRYWKKLK